MNLQEISQESQERLRIIQESVPGKQITIAHIIANPDKALYLKVGLSPNQSETPEEKALVGAAIGIVTITPGETAIIAADLAIKAGGVELGFVDRINGTLIITGSVSEVEASLTALTQYAQEKLGFNVCSITKT